MNLARLRLGELVAAAGGAGLLATLFGTWFRESRGGVSTPSGFTAYAPVAAVHHSGWDSLGWLMLALLVVLIGLALTLAVVTAGRLADAVPVVAAILTAFTGILVFPILCIVVVAHDGDMRAGADLGLLCCLLIPVGGWLSLRDERTKASYSAPPDLVPRPAPPTA